jgi:hypothetical protein
MLITDEQILIVVSIVFGLYLLVMYRHKKIVSAQDKEIEELKKQIPIPPTDKEPTARRIVTKIVFLNNATDVKHELYSEEGNEFGLSWNITDTTALICVNQKHSLDENDWTPKARLNNCSVVDICWKEIDLKKKES